jgi:integrase
MSLYRRGRIWWAYYYIDGIRHQASTNTSNRRDAERILDQLKRDAALQRHGVTPACQPEMTFGALVARFIAAGESRPHHRDRFTALLSYFAETAIGRIGKPMVREYRQARHTEKSVTDATINRDVSVLRHLLYWAVDEGVLTANPLARVRLVRERPAPRPVVRIDEERRLLEAAPPHLRELTILGLDTGMRRGELLHQRWEHVDFSRDLLAVTQSKTSGGEGREIPFTSRVRDLLRRRAADRGALFEYRDHPIGTIKTAWKATRRRAGIRHIRFHDLRHTFNTRLVDLGVLQEVRKALMGHSSGSNVHARYTHIELPLKRDAIQRLDTWHRAQSSNSPGRSPHQQEEPYESRQIGHDEGRPARTEAVEKKDPGGSRLGTSRQAPPADRAR